MNSLPRVKERARELRSSALKRSDDLFVGLTEELKDRRIKLKPVTSGLIGGADAILTMADKSIRYDKALDEDPVQRLLIIGHEAGHIVLHKRLEDKLAGVGPLSPYFNTGGPSLARYNRRSREEIEADAFANEFVCPSNEVFEKWKTDRNSTSVTLGKEYSISQGMMSSRLAEALFEEQLVNAPKPERGVKDKDARIDDPIQIEAARHVGSPALVNAGPGTGKTATLIMRIDHLLRELHAEPKELLVVTFSNEAAEELRSRIESEFGVEVAEEVEITTFHGFGHAALLEWESDLHKEFTILDDSRQEELVFELLGETECDSILNLREPLETARNCVRLITKLKERRISPDDFEARILEWEGQDTEQTTKQAEARALLDVYRTYDDAKREMKAVDFPDLINMPLDLLEVKPELVEEIRKKYKWVMVDEYQDVSRSVANLLVKICGPENPPWVVGDLRQAIYVFCGAAPENVTNFSEEFPKAKIFELGTNYRSCQEIITVANQLADVIRDPDKTTGEFEELWSRGSDEESLEGEDSAMRIAQADSDIAEYDGVAGQVQAWLEFVRPDEIAVLSRRNKDVRRLCVELGKRGIKVATPGLISTDGVAGLMACVASFVDGDVASLPRIVYGLGARRFDRAVLDRAIEMANADQENLDLSGEPEGVATLIGEITRLRAATQAIKYAGDAFAMMCTFLFDGSDYLRRVLADENETRRSMEISELLSSLSWAVSYRYSHSGIKAPAARVGFAQFFRGILATGRPALVPPRPVEGAVQVMTCHASKGLEFPCVAVMGQTLSLMTKRMKSKSWVPPGIESEKEDRDQADALLFVGATRAKKSLLVSYAKTSQRELPALLVKWIAKHSIAPTAWEKGAEGENKFSFQAVWGVQPVTKRLSASNLDQKWCGLRVYVQDLYGGEFPTVNDSLYPMFFGAVRRAIGEVIQQAANGKNVSQEDAAAIFLTFFDKEWLTKHPLYELYKRRGFQYVTGFTAKLGSLPVPSELLEADEMFGGEIGVDPLAIRFGMTAYYKDSSGNSHAVMFRPESMKAKAGVSEISWTNLKANKTPLLMLRHSDPNLRPWIFSGGSSEVYGLKWNRATETTASETANAIGRREAFTAGVFEGTITEFKCETQCENRTNCPYWMTAASFPEELN